MNLREGTRRLALLLGVAGAIVGGFASYMELQTVSAQTTAHKQFEQLANSPVVQQARESCFQNRSQSEHGPWEKYQNPEQGPPPFNSNSPYCIEDPNTNQSYYTPFKLKSGGTKTIHFENREIASIETEDGQTLYPTPSPGGWSYFLIFLLPVLGFLIPWGAIRAIGWVGAGFVRPVSHT